MEPIVINRDGTTYWIVPQYKYDISAEVVSTDHYWDPPIEISPIDLSLAWGYVVHPKIKKHIDFSHGWRYVQYKTKSDAPKVIREHFAYIVAHVSNNHLIPANESIEYGIANAEVGNKVRLKGYLVNVHCFDEDGNRTCQPWKTSVHRYDHGNTGCEIMYVTEAQVNQNLYTSDFDPADYQK
ncbi:MAG: hypothetical protein ABEJ65_03985 [bacterium]